MNVAGVKSKQLKRLFPGVFSGDKSNFEHLKRMLREWVEQSKERFGLDWPERAKCMWVTKQPSIATLKPSREESVNFDETGNLFVECVYKFRNILHPLETESECISPPHIT